MNVLQPGDTVDHRYTLLACLGKGGAGEVWSVEDTDISRRVALKVILDSDDSDKAWREIKLHGSLDQHPNIVDIYTSGRWINPADESRYRYLTMPIMDCTLHSYLNENDKLSLSQIVPLFRQIAEGLHFAHLNGLIHCDVKTNNILLNTSNGRIVAKVCDFGLSYQLTHVDQARRQAGTFLFMAPEVWNSNPHSVASDVYSLTATLFYALTRSYPFMTDKTTLEEIKQDLSWKHCGLPRPLVTHFRPDLPAGLDQIIATGMAADATKRYESVLDFADALESVLRENQTPPTVSRPIQVVELVTAEGDPLTDRTHDGAVTRAPCYPAQYTYSVLGRAPVKQAANFPLHTDKTVEVYSDEQTLHDPGWTGTQINPYIAGLTGSRIDTHQLKAWIEARLEMKFAHDEFPNDHNYNGDQRQLYADVLKCDTLIIVLTRDWIKLTYDRQAIWPQSKTGSATQAAAIALKRHDDMPILFIYEDEMIRNATLRLPPELHELSRYTYSGGLVLAWLDKRG